MPTMEPDFNWADVQATVPVYKKGDYELAVKSVRGGAWAKKDKHGNPTGEITKVLRIRPVMVGVVDSKGKLQSELDGKPIKDQPAEEVNLWLHSDGGRRMAKQQMMAIAGYNPNEPKEEEAFNAFLAKSGLDLSARVEEREDGSGFDLTIGEGWEKLLVGKNFRAHMEPETREMEGRDPVEQQNYVRLSPVNSKK